MPVGPFFVDKMASVVPIACPSCSLDWTVLLREQVIYPRHWSAHRRLWNVEVFPKSTRHSAANGSVSDIDGNKTRTMQAINSQPRTKKCLRNRKVLFVSPARCQSFHVVQGTQSGPRSKAQQGVLHNVRPNHQSRYKSAAQCVQRRRPLRAESSGPGDNARSFSHPHESQNFKTHFFHQFQ